VRCIDKKKVGRNFPTLPQVPGEGVEPPRPFGHSILIAACLPISTSGLIFHCTRTICFVNFDFSFSPQSSRAWRQRVFWLPHLETPYCSAIPHFRAPVPCWRGVFHGE